jgi:hypothetical protein
VLSHHLSFIFYLYLKKGCDAITSGQKIRHSSPSRHDISGAVQQSSLKEAMNTTNQNRYDHESNRTASTIQTFYRRHSTGGVSLQRMSWVLAPVAFCCDDLR